MTEHRYTMQIEQWKRWGPMSWYGNVLWQTRGDEIGKALGVGDRWSLGLTVQDGWSAWSRAGLERKLRRHIARERRRHERRDSTHEEILA